METEIKALVKFQQRYQKLLQVQREKERIPKKYNESKQELEKSEEFLKNLQGRLDKVIAEEKSSNLRATEIEEKLKGIKQKESMVTTQKEFEAVDKEAETLRQDKDDVGMRLLEIEEEIAPLKTEVENQEKKVAEIREKTQAEYDSISFRIETLNQEAKELEREIEDLKSTIPDKVISDAPSMISRRGHFVSTTQDSVCQSCYVQIPARINSEVMKGESIINCPKCSVYLVPAPFLRMTF